MNNPLKKIAEPVECVCNRSDGLFIPSRQVSFLISALLVILFITFLSGYFFGKKHMVEQFVAKVEQDSFADQIYSSLCALSDCEPDELRQMVVEDEAVQAAQPTETVLANVDEQPELQETISSVPSQMMVAQDTVAETKNASDEKTIQQQYSAQLIGYGTEIAAKKFASRLQKKEIDVEIKKRTSRSSKGTNRSWYQVVLAPSHDKEAVEKLVDRISKEEKLKGVRVITC